MADSLNKRDIRRRAIRLRDAASDERRAKWDAAIAGRLAAMPEYDKAASVLFFASFRSEVGTGAMIEHALNSGKTVLLPKVDRDNGTLSKHVICGLHEVEPGYMGIPEPVTSHCMRVEEIGLILVPGVAFDARGGRIGYGGGYYDRLLPRVKGTKPIVALAYEAQMFDALPVEGHDVLMDYVITEERVIRCDE